MSSVDVVLPLMFIGGAASWSINAPLNHRLTGLAPELPTVGISFNSSGTYLGQALGAAVGGILLAAHSSARTLCIVGAVAAGLTFGLQIAGNRSSGSAERRK